VSATIRHVLVLCVLLALSIVAVKTLLVREQDDAQPEHNPSARGRVVSGWQANSDRVAPSGWAFRAVDPRSGVVFVLVEPGTFETDWDFVKGAPSDRKPVRVAQPFYLAETEVTVAQWNAFGEASGYDHAPGGAGDHHPQGWIAARDALAYCQHYGYYLPSEKEWEYACLGGATSAQEWRLNLDAIAWHGGNTTWVAQPVRQKQPNAWGLYDMVGNVEEWCTTQQHTDPWVVRGGSARVRGGFCSPSIRSTIDPASRQRLVGFRPARVTQ